MAAVKPQTRQQRRAQARFDSDDKAKERYDDVVALGGVDYHRRLKDWDTTEQLRSLFNQQKRANGRRHRLEQQITKGYEDSEVPIEDIEGLEAERDPLEVEANETSYAIVALLLVDDAGKTPDIAMLKAKVDVEEIGKLASELSSGGEDEDPTAEAPSD